jgi:alpha-tubulin suppressor-like RCC1 family protein
MATTISGLLFTWGQNVYGELGIGNYTDQDQPVSVELIHHYKVVQMSAGKHHSAAVTSCGKLFTWGANPDRRLF